MLNFHQSLPFLNWLFPLLHFPTRFSCMNFLQDFPTRFSLQQFPARFSHKIFPQDFPATISRKIFKQQFPTTFPARISRKIFPQDFPTRFSCNNFPQQFLQDFPELDPDWLAPHHPIPNAKFPPITAFLKLFFSPPPFLQDFPARIYCKIFHNNFPHFPARFSLKIFPSWIPDWLAPHHPIPNVKFPPITTLLNRPTYHKRSKVSPPPFPQILWEPQINE